VGGWTVSVSVPKKSGGASGETVSGLLRLPMPGRVGVLWIRGEPPELPACFPAVMAASIQTLCRLPLRVNVHVSPLSLSSAQGSRFSLQWLPSIPLYRPRQEPPPQEFEEPVGKQS